MNIYLAPLEGITSNIFRTAQHKYFGGIDKYFAPFITPSDKGKLSTKAQNDLEPNNNIGQILVPQILTNNAEGFVYMCKSLEDKYGYREFNLNLGCPSGTVVSKGRGSGFLAFPEELDRFLDEIYKSDYTISIKTRIGKLDSEEFYTLLDIYNKYPVSELIIHPRTRQDMYKNSPNWQMYNYATQNSLLPLCYNGDIFTLKDYNKFVDKFPNTTTIMLGRGVVANPALPNIIKENKELDINKLKQFYYEVQSQYADILSGQTPLLHKMKEILVYMVDIFQDTAKISKKLKKSKSIDEFNNHIEELFATCRLK